MSNYNYNKNLRKPVILRLVHEYHEYYRLEFCTTRRRWFRIWHTVKRYEPGIVGSYFSVGEWKTRWFKVLSDSHGEELLAELRKKFKTVSDIYHHYIEPDERRQADYNRRCDDYIKKSNSVPTVIS